MHKFAVWGVGGRGTYLIALLGIERISVIIDRNVELQGTMFQGIRVISPEEYLEEYKEYPVIITPKGHESNIEKWLNEHGVFWAFSFELEQPNIESVLKQVHIDDLTAGYEQGEIVSIWGYTALGILLYELLREKNFQCRMVLEEFVPEDARHFIQKILGMTIESISDCREGQHKVLLTKKINAEYQKCFEGNRVQKCYDLGLERDRFYSPELEKFKDIHKGKKCFIVATGPSLKTSDLSKLYENGEICISMNGIFPAFQETEWRPNYYVLSDLRTCMRWSENILDFSCDAKFIADVAWVFDNEKEYHNMYKWHLIRQWDGMPEFSNDFAMGTFVGGTVTYDGGLQLAAYMGFSEIYLLGVDCSYQVGSCNNHFTPEKEPDKIVHEVDRMQLAFMSARKYADEHGIKIYNATRGGMLEVFERVDFDSLF